MPSFLSSPSPAPPTGSLLADSEGQGFARVPVPSLDVLPDYFVVQVVVFPLNFCSMVFVDWAKNLFILFDGGKTTDYFLELLQTRGITSCSNIYRKFLLEANLRYTTIKVLRRFDVELQNYTEIRRRAKFQKKKETQKPILGTQRSCCSSNENVKCKRQKIRHHKCLM